MSAIHVYLQIVLSTIMAIVISLFNTIIYCAMMIFTLTIGLVFVVVYIMAGDGGKANHDDVVGWGKQFDGMSFDLNNRHK
jgi:hypothetical protein